MDDKPFALLAATFAAVICMAIVQFFGPDSPMVRRRRERERSGLYREMWNRGRWFPPATGEPRPAPPAPPPVPLAKKPVAWAIEWIGSSSIDRIDVRRVFYMKDQAEEHVGNCKQAYRVVPLYTEPPEVT